MPDYQSSRLCAFGIVNWWCIDDTWIYWRYMDDIECHSGEWTSSFSASPRYRSGFVLFVLLWAIKQYWLKPKLYEAAHIAASRPNIFDIWLYVYSVLCTCTLCTPRQLIIGPPAEYIFSPPCFIWRCWWQPQTYQSKVERCTNKEIPLWCHIFHLALSRQVQLERRLSARFNIGISICHLIFYLFWGKSNENQANF